MTHIGNFAPSRYAREARWKEALVAHSGVHYLLAHVRAETDFQSLQMLVAWVWLVRAASAFRELCNPCIKRLATTAWGRLRPSSARFLNSQGEEVVAPSFVTDEGASAP